VSAIPIHRRGAGGIARAIAVGEVSAVQVLHAFLARVEALDADLRCFLRLNPAAEEEAAAVDRGERRGPLAGVPVAIKDNLCTAGLETSCASRVLAGFLPRRDAAAVARLRAAGAVVLGKTNLDEFAMGSSTENSAHGPTRNPWDRTRVPGGSSGGSAAAVAAGLAPVALGSDTGGSVRQPAAFCGITGLKPTYGRVSRSGLVAFGSSLDQVGPLARSVEDAARILEVVAGPDPDDATSARVPAGGYLEACGRGAAGLRVGLASSLLGDGVDPGCAAGVRAAARALVEAGASVEEVDLPHAGWAIPVYYLVATSEASSNLARYDGVRFGPRAGHGDDLRAMIRATRGAGFGPEVKRRILLGTFALSAGYHDAYYGRAMRARTLIRKDFEAAFARGIDAILLPTTPTPAFPLGEKVDDPLAMYLSDVFTVTINLAGLPAISVPAGTSGGLPVGAQLVAADFDEATLFRAGAAVEAAMPAGIPPDPA
jgi:aspartyl-tRNA(Asn)/glutamyl-tRNA(Gln) amidotransferase subunit A